MKKVLFITSYPEKNNTHGKSTVGVASYAKNTINAIRKSSRQNLEITVLAERLNGEKNYSQSKVNVKRIWKRNTFSIFPKLIKEVYKNHRTDKTVVVEFELAMFGNLLYLLPFPLFLITLKLMGKRIIFVAHQVIPNIKELAFHINISERSFAAFLINIALKIFYPFILLISNKTIVFEKELKNRLSKFGSSKKITVIPHGVERFEKIPTKREARRKLKLKEGEFVAVAFGYLAWYKGSDWLIDAVSKLNARKNYNKISLILAGGPNPNHTNKNYYHNYIERLSEKAVRNGIKITGFVDEKDIPYYYQSADVIIFPYRTFMSSSGPLSFSFAFKKPFLISKALKPTLSNKDMKKALEKNKVEPQRMIFDDMNDFSRKIKEVQKNSKFRKKLHQVTKGLSEKRSWEVIGGKYYDEIFN